MKAGKLPLACLLLAFASTAAADDNGHPVSMWEIKGDSNTIYLLGSVHLLRATDYPLPQVITMAYENADSLIMEVDMDDLNPVAMQAQFTALGLIQDERSLESLMGPALYQEALAAAEEIDIPLHLLERTEPWYAAMTVEMMMLGRLGFDPNLGVEMHLTEMAVADDKLIDGLETIVEQLEILDGLSLQAQRDMLMSTLEESASLGSTMDDTISAWRRGDTTFLEATLLDNLRQFDELNRVLVTDRNRRWVEQIEALLDDSEDYLIVVGALHLVGAEGVPRLLGKAGHSIEQLSEPPALR